MPRTALEMVQSPDEATDRANYPPATLSQGPANDLDVVVEGIARLEVDQPVRPAGKGPAGPGFVDRIAFRHQLKLRVGPVEQRHTELVVVEAGSVLDAVDGKDRVNSPGEALRDGVVGLGDLGGRHSEPGQPFAVKLRELERFQQSEGGLAPLFGAAPQHVPIGRRPQQGFGEGAYRRAAEVEHPKTAVGIIPARRPIPAPIPAGRPNLPMNPVEHRVLGNPGNGRLRGLGWAQSSSALAKRITWRTSSGPPSIRSNGRRSPSP